VVFRGLFALFDNASLRQLAIGACIAIGIVAVFAVYRHVSADPGRHPSEWLVEAEVADLASAIQSLQTEHNWVAGCLWDGDDRRIDQVLDLPRGSRHFFVGSARSGRTMALVVVEREPPASVEVHEQQGAFCLVPTNTR
jgi:hypothetical protein